MTTRRTSLWSDWVVDVTPTLLFRYSALTYNGHRIHYDRDYARDVEATPDRDPRTAARSRRHRRPGDTNLGA